MRPKSISDVTGSGILVTGGVYFLMMILMYISWPSTDLIDKII